MVAYSVPVKSGDLNHGRKLVTTYITKLMTVDSFTVIKESYPAYQESMVKNGYGFS